MSSEERERYVAENSHLGNKRYVQMLIHMPETSVADFLKELISVLCIRIYVYTTRIWIRHLSSIIEIMIYSPITYSHPSSPIHTS